MLLFPRDLLLNHIGKVSFCHVREHVHTFQELGVIIFGGGGGAGSLVCLPQPVIGLPWIRCSPLDQSTTARKLGTFTGSGQLVREPRGGWGGPNPALHRGDESLPLQGHCRPLVPQTRKRGAHP